MHSNFITPPDFVDGETLVNITVINASLDDVEMLARMCESSYETFNIYLYHSEMADVDWLQGAIDRSEVVIVNSDRDDFDHVCELDKTYYYGERKLITRATYVPSPLHYFALRAEKE